jgi:hypothetical protein
MEPHEDQWSFLSALSRMSPREVDRLSNRTRAVSVGVKVDRLVSATSSRIHPAPAAVVPLRLHAGIRLAMADLTPALLATLKHAASMANPDFYDRQRRRVSTWNIPRFIRSYDETLDGGLVLPRGMGERVTALIEQAGSRAEPLDERVSGNGRNFSFTPSLTAVQREAVEALGGHDLGVLVAPPGAGKTVMACAAIAQRGVSALVLVDRKTLADQWRTQISELLGVKAV